MISNELISDPEEGKLKMFLKRHLLKIMGTFIVLYACAILACVICALDTGMGDTLTLAVFGVIATVVSFVGWMVNAMALSHFKIEGNQYPKRKRLATDLIGIAFLTLTFVLSMSLRIIPDEPPVAKYLVTCNEKCEVSEILATKSGFEILFGLPKNSASIMPEFSRSATEDLEFRIEGTPLRLRYSIEAHPVFTLDKRALKEICSRHSLASEVKAEISKSVINFAGTVRLAITEHRKKKEGGLNLEELDSELKQLKTDPLTVKSVKYMLRPKTVLQPTESSFDDYR